MKKPASFLVVFYLVALLLWPMSVFAEAANQAAPSALSLTPPDTDLSVGYLGNIFGVVDGVLAGTGSQLLGAMFSIFNGAVLVLGGIVILYTLFVSTINTAGEGEVLGKRWSSIWIPLRSVIGITLLIPKASGYSFIQIFMMWVAVMGVGAADSIWNRALDYFVGGGVLIQQNSNLNRIPGSEDVVAGAKGLLRSLTCMNMLQSELNKYRKAQVDQGIANPITPPPNFYQGVMSAINNNVDKTSATTVLIPNEPNRTGVTNYAIFNGVCGFITWSNIGVDPSMPENVKKSVGQARGLAVQSMVSQMNGVAQAIVRNATVDDPVNNRLPLGKIISDRNKSPLIWGAGELNKPKRYLLPGSTLSDAALTYFGIVAPALNYAQNTTTLKNLMEGWIKDAKEKGWIIAGRYYYDVIELNNRMSIRENNPPVFNADKLATLNSNNSVVKNFFPTGTSYSTDLSNLVNGSPSSNNLPKDYELSTSIENGTFLKDADDYGRSLTYGYLTQINLGDSSGSSGEEIVDQIASVFLGNIYSIIKGFVQLGLAQESNANPVLSLAMLGSGLVSVTTTAFIAMAVVSLVATLALGAAWGFTFSSAIVAVMTVLMGLFSPVLIALLVAGLTMAFYIPIIPFIIFTFGAIGWFISVIEAIIAAPLVALGIAHPEGAEILGKAEPAVILLVNVFLRPTFMIFGFLIGMMLSYVGVWILNQGFWPAYEKASTSGVTGLAWIFFPIAMLVIYALLVMQIVQKSFSLIYIIPDEVLKWIGGNIKGMGGEAEAESKIAGGYAGAAQAQSQVVSKAPEAAKSINEDSEKRAQAGKAENNQGLESTSPSPSQSSAQSQNAGNNTSQSGPGAPPAMTGGSPSSNGSQMGGVASSPAPTKGPGGAGTSGGPGSGSPPPGVM